MTAEQERLLDRLEELATIIDRQLRDANDKAWRAHCEDNVAALLLGKRIPDFEWLDEVDTPEWHEYDAIQLALAELDGELALAALSRQPAKNRRR